MAEIDGDFGRLKLPLPPHFSGEPRDWEEWEWNFRTYISMFQPNVLNFLDRAATSDAEIVDAHFQTAQATPAEQERLVTFSRKLHYLLANLCTGSARLLVRQNQGGNGFETWRLLHQRFSLPDASRHVSLLTKILDWKFNTHTFEQDFNAWETVKNKYEQQTGQQLPDSILVATLMNKTSGPLQQHLRLNAGNINTFDQVKQLLVQYFRSRHILNIPDTSGPMDVGAIKGKGKKGKGKGKNNFSHWYFMKGKGGNKGKGKGKYFKGSKGKGKGKQWPQTSNKGKGKGTITNPCSSTSVVCYTCGRPGHTSRECRAGRINAVDDTSGNQNESSWNETSWNNEWSDDWTSWDDPSYFGDYGDSWDDYFIGNVGHDDWWTSDDWTSWDDWSWAPSWASWTWNEAGQSSTAGTSVPPTLQQAQTRTSVQVTLRLETKVLQLRFQQFWLSPQDFKRVRSQDRVLALLGVQSLQ